MCCDRERAKKLGIIGEEKTAEYLKSKGCIIIKRNWKDRYGELDIVAEDGENIIFVEVKTRTEGAVVSGAEAVDAGKMRRTRNAAEMFVKRLHTNLKPRIDVAEITVSKGKDGELKGRLNYIKNAF